MAYYRFVYELGAEGDTEEEALDNALDAFVVDPGEPSKVERFDSIETFFGEE